jgi:hypothetical protein
LPFALNHLVVPHLRRLAEKLPGNVERNLAELEMEGTLLPLYQQFNLPNGMAGPAQDGMRKMKRVVGDPAATRICVDCLIDDEKDHGFPYLHRSHQIPGTTACWRHGRPLVDRCPACDRPYAMTKELVLTAWKGCECGLHLEELSRRIKKSAAKNEVEFANFSKDLLANEAIELSAQDLVELYRVQANKLGMGWGSAQVNRQKFISRLTTFYGKGFLSRVDPAFRAGKMTGWMKVFESSASFEAPVYRHILVAYFLFRTYTNFRKSALKLINDQENAPRTVIRQSEKSPEQETLSAMLCDLTSTALRYNYSIKQLWIMRSGTMKRLVKFSPDAVKKLESKIKRRKTTKKKMVGTRPQNTSSSEPLNDQRWSEALIETSAMFYQNDERPRFVSANALLGNTSYHPKGFMIPKVDEHPLAFRTLKSNAESQWHFYARRILWALQGLNDPQVPAYMIVRQAGLEYHKGLAVLEYFSDCPRSVGASILLVNEILARKGIGRNWLGPCPERDFPKKAGRAHQAAAMSKLTSRPRSRSMQDR